uniref:DUF7027 domain-containing protein n=1 Tax=Romanomermis culicivorax TaxID=13658 RepID=A0A915J6T0_ROMCU
MKTMPLLTPDYDSYNRCCCNTMHIRTGAFWVGVCQLISVVLNAFIVFLQAFFVDSHHRKQLNFSIIAFICLPLILTPIVVGLMFWGLYKYKANFLIPHLVYQMLIVIVLLSGALLTAVNLAFVRNVFEAPVKDLTSSEETRMAEGNGDPGDKTFHGLHLFNIILFLLTMIIEIWFLCIVYKCYRYLKNK